MTTVAEVDLSVDGSAVLSAIDIINKRINSIAGSVQKIVESANQGAANFDRQLGNQIKGLQQSLSQIATLERSLKESVRQGSKPISQANANASLARQTAQASTYAKTLRNATTAADALQARLNEINKRIAGLGADGQLAKRKDLSKQLNVDKALTDLKRLDRELERLDAKARQSGGDFSQTRQGVAAARQALASATLTPRRVNFSNELNAVTDAQARYNAEVLAGRKAQSDALRIAKEHAALDVKAAAEAGNLAKVRAASELKIAEARSALTAAGSVDRRQLLESIELEKTRLRLIQQEEVAQRRTAANPSAKPTGLARVLNSDYIGAAVGRTAIYGATAGLGYGAVSAIQSEIQQVAEFEDKLKTLQAIAGATDAQLGSLTATIVTVGRTSRYSLSDIVDATTTLAQAGFSITDMQKSLSSITALAAASGSSLQQTVDVVTSAIGSFQLQTAETSRVSDVLVTALNRSKLTLSQVGEAIQYVGATAYENNISLEQLVATAGALANAGIKSGSTIGTGLRQFLVDLQTPTTALTDQMKRLGISFADIDVKSRGLPAVIQTLTDKGFGAAQAYSSLETRAAAAFVTLKNNLDVYDDLILAEAQQGAAAEANAKAMDSLSAQWQRFKNILSTGFIADLQRPMELVKGLIRDLGDRVADMQRAASELEERKAGGLAGYVSRAGGNKLSGFANYENENFFSDAAAGAYKLQNAALDLASPSFYLGGRGMGQRWDDYVSGASKAALAAKSLATATADATEKTNAQQQTVDGLKKEIGRLLLQQDSLSKNQKAAETETLSLSSRFQGLALHISGATDNIHNLLSALRAYRKEQLGSLGTALTGEIGAIRNERAGLQGQYGQRLAGVRNTSGYSGLSAKEQRALTNPAIGVNAQIISDAAARVAKQFPQLAQGLNSISSLAGRYVTLGLQAQQKVAQVAQVSAATSAGGQQISNTLEALTAQFQQAQTAATGQKPTARAAGFVQIRGRIRSAISSLQAQLGNPQSDGARQFRQQALSEFQSLDNQITAVVTPTVREGRTAASDARHLQTQQQRAKRKFNANARFVDETTLKVDELDLADDLAVVGKAKAVDVFNQATGQVDIVLKTWIADRTELVEQDIKTRGLAGAQADEYRREIGGQIREKQERVAQALADAFGKMIEAQVKAIDLTFNNALVPYATKLTIAQGARSGLDRASLAGKVPDYVRTLADRRSAEAQEAYDNAQIPALEAKIVGLKQALDQVRSEQARNDAAATKDNANVVAAIRAAENRIQGDELETQIGQADAQLQGQRAAQAASDQVPTSLAGGLSKAARAFQEAHSVGSSFVEMLNNEMGGVVEELNAQFGNFFATILTGSGSALSAFANLAKGIIRYIEQMVAKAIATRLFGALINLAGVKAAAGASLNGVGAVGGVAAFNGGYIRKYASGGEVLGGLRSRDSVPAMLAKGEFVIRNRAVDSLGVDFLDRLNRHGASGLSGMSQVLAAAAGKRSHVEANVYVVSPESKPSLGPNDVLLVIQDDLLKGGQTRQLVKHIAAGG